ncbi:MAG: glycosyltransferase family 4 protein [Verrucomicrobiales bacterium]|nr:glycosyltransferase family 4 protein [Verrucomicrobiales bacterium]
MEPGRPRITYITAGAGGMYCGSCIRDNALVGELNEMGWDVTLLPLYTPIRTDEEDRSVDHVLFGGINVFLQQKIPLFRHLPGFFDRWLDNPKFIRRVASGNMTVDASHLGAMTLSMVKGEDGYQKREVKKLVRWLKEVAKPDILCLTNLLVGGSIPALKRELGIPVYVTLQGDDVFLDELVEPWQSQVLTAMKSLATQVDGFITFSEFYRDRMVDLLDIDPAKFRITPLGIDTSDFDSVAQSRKAKEPGKNLGYFARICPEKGFDLIVSAFLKLAEQDNDWRLSAGGWLSAKDEEFFEVQKQRIFDAHLEDRFVYYGSPDHEGKLNFFGSVDLFCVPARFVEPKGLYILEAMACGIPVVAPDRGAFPELIAQSGGGLLFESESVEDLVEKLQDVEPAAGDMGREWVVENGSRRAMAQATAKIFEA